MLRYWPSLQPRLPFKTTCFLRPNLIKTSKVMNLRNEHSLTAIGVNTPPSAQASSLASGHRRNHARLLIPTDRSSAVVSLDPHEASMNAMSHLNIRTNLLFVRPQGAPHLLHVGLCIFHTPEAPLLGDGQSKCVTKEWQSHSVYDTTLERPSRLISSTTFSPDRRVQRTTTQSRPEIFRQKHLLLSFLANKLVIPKPYFKV